MIRSSNTARAATLLVALALSVAACGRQRGASYPESAPQADALRPAESGNVSHRPPGIDWFDGEPEAAFAQAKASDRPLFLYWGAEWCPPCAQIKSTIFNRREFQERSRLFVPVYLDGDTPGAQKHGEKFGVVGYPTMILFEPDGTEIARLPGGVDVEKYASILDVALGKSKPVAELLATARAGGALGTDDWRLLAYHSWATDNGRTLPAELRLDTFRLLSDRCPVELAPDCTRLLFEYLSAAADASTDTKPALNGLDRAIARRSLLERLGSPAVARANVASLSHGADSVISLLSDTGTPERLALTTGWRAALDNLEAPGADVGLSPPERLNVLRGRVQLAKLEAPEAPLPAALLDTVRDAVATVDAGSRDPYARQAAINAAGNLYWEAGLDDDANALLVAELEKSASPYYFMLDLADLAQKAGREKEAVDWLARAYADARGPATRFQWGANYLVGLVEMTPDDTTRIERVGLELLGELDASPDAFYQRTRRQLEKLDGLLLEWGDDPARRKVIEHLRTRTAEICASLPEGDEGRQHCEEFLRPDPAVANA